MPPEREEEVDVQDTAHHTSRRRDLLLLLLLLLGGAVKGRVWCATTVLTRDGIGFIEFASRLRQESWSEVLNTTDQHPLYPLHIFSVARLYEQFLPHTMTCYDWEFCAHLANFTAGLLLAIPMYFLGKRLGGWSIGFTGALLFQVLPVPVRITVDTLSEGTYLLLTVTALWAALRGLDTKHLRWFLLAGVFGGLAYLTRPEGVLVPLCTVLALLGLRSWGWWQASWAKTGACLASLGVAALLVIAPYCCTIGRLSPKRTFRDMVHQSATTRPSPGRGMLLASRFQPGVNGASDYEVDWGFVIREVGRELLKGFHYVVWLPAFIGVWLLARRVKRVPHDAPLVLVLMLFVANLFVLFWLGYRAHYVSERHTMLIVLIGCWTAMLALQAGAAWLSARWPRWQGRTLQLQGFAVALLVGFGLIQSLRGLHEHRLGHRLAGEWLAPQLRPGDQLVDPYGWVSFYAGRRSPPPPAGTPASGRLFLVLEPGEKDLPRQRQINSVARRPEKPRFAWPAWTDSRLEVYEIPPRGQALPVIKPPSGTPTANETVSGPVRN